jgi:hypothetical protein
MASEQIRVNASELAALVGMHAFKSALEATADLWKRTHPASFRAASLRCNKQIRTTAETLRCAPAAVTQTVRAAAKARTEAQATDVAAKAMQLPLIQASETTILRMSRHVIEAAHEEAIGKQAIGKQAIGKQAFNSDSSADSKTVSADSSIVSTEAQDELKRQIKTLVHDDRVADRVVAELQSVGSKAVAASALASADSNADTEPEPDAAKDKEKDVQARAQAKAQARAQAQAQMAAQMASQIADQVRAVLQTPKVADCKETAAAVASSVNTWRGIRHEGDGIRLYEHATGHVVTGKNDRVYTRKLQVQDSESDSESGAESDSESDCDDDSEESGSESASESGSDSGSNSESESTISKDSASSSNSESGSSLTVVLSGRVDGLVDSAGSAGSADSAGSACSVSSSIKQDDNANKVVEVKCRRARFFASLPLYELVQAHAYMFLTGRAHCDVVEKLGKKIRITPVAFDSKFWKRVRILAIRAAKRVHKIPKRSAASQDMLFTAAAACRCS